MRLQARQDAELGEHVQRIGRAGRLGQVARVQQLLVDFPLFRGAQAIGDIDDTDAVNHGLVVLVVAEGLPFRLVGVGQHHALIGDGPDAFGADIVALLGGGQQRVQDLERRLEHLDKFQEALGRQVEAAAIGIGVRVALAVEFEFADIDLADQGGDVLVVVVARFGLGHADLVDLGGHQAHDRELGDVAAEFTDPLDRPGRHQPGQIAVGNPILVLQHAAHAVGVEQAERRFEHRADLVAGLEHVDGELFHQRLQPLGERRLAAADRAEKVEDLLALFQALSGVLEKADNALDGVFHAVKISKA